MDRLRSVAVVSVAELLLLGSFTPELTESSPDEATHRRHHGRVQVQSYGLTRGDMPVIFNWLGESPGDRPTPG